MTFKVNPSPTPLVPTYEPLPLLGLDPKPDTHPDLVLTKTVACAKKIIPPELGMSKQKEIK